MNYTKDDTWVPRGNIYRRICISEDLGRNSAGDMPGWDGASRCLTPSAGREKT